MFIVKRIVCKSQNTHAAHFVNLYYLSPNNKTVAYAKKQKKNGKIKTTMMVKMHTREFIVILIANCSRLFSTSAPVVVPHMYSFSYYGLSVYKRYWVGHCVLPCSV